MEATFSVGAQIFEDNLYDDTAAYRGRLTYRLSRRYAVEASLAVNWTELTVRDHFPSGDVTLILYHGSIVYLFPMGKYVTTFTTMGIGGITRDFKGGTSDNDLAFTFGGGVRFRLTERVGLRFDIADFVSSLDIGGFLPSGGRVFVEPSGRKHLLEIDGGISIGF
ncbi:MAG: outer membrane beta-barrel protein [Candidatus Latescibacteria bacterium]|nr:outer membrane beta-barrel protein [Candidatus Latescibacterota bacterium]